MEGLLIFTKFGRVIAWLLVIVGSFRAALAFTIVFTNDQAMALRYLGSKTTGEVIDASLLYILIGVAVGMMAEMSRSIAAKVQAKQSLE